MVDTYDKLSNAVTGSARSVTNFIGEGVQNLTGGSKNAEDAGISAETVKTATPWLGAGAAALTGMLLLDPLTKLGKGILKATRAVVTGGGYFEKIPLIGGVFKFAGDAVETLGDFTGMALTAVGSFLTFKALYVPPSPPAGKTQKEMESGFDASGATTAAVGSAAVVTASHFRPTQLTSTRLTPIVVRESNAIISDKPEVAAHYKEAMDYSLRNKTGQDNAYNPDEELYKAAKRVNSNASLEHEVKKIYHHRLDTLPHGESVPLDEVANIIKKVVADNPQVTLGEKINVKIGNAKIAVKNAATQTKQFLTGSPNPQAETVMNSLLIVDGARRWMDADSTSYEKKVGVSEVAAGSFGSATKVVGSFLAEGGVPIRALSGVARATGGAAAGLIAPLEYQAARESFSKTGASKLDYTEGAGHTLAASGGTLIAGGTALELGGTGAALLGWSGGSTVALVGTGTATVGTIILVPAALIGTGALAYKTGNVAVEAYQTNQQVNTGLEKLKTGGAYTKGKDLNKIEDLTSTLQTIALSADGELTKAGMKKIENDKVIYDLSSIEKMEKLRNILSQRIAISQQKINSNNNPLRYLAFWKYYSVDDVQGEAIAAHAQQAGDIGAQRMLNKLIAITKEAAKTSSISGTEQQVINPPLPTPSTKDQLVQR